MLKEYISHSLIGTPLEPTALGIRKVLNNLRQIQKPEMADTYIESERMRQVIDRVVDDSTNCIDVGGHLGSILQYIKERSPQGKHMGVEPVPYKAAWLAKKFPEMEILQIALSDKPGEAEFFVQDSSAYSGLRLQGAGTQTVSTVKVACKRLDDIVPNDKEIGFIKLDAEGGELNVLGGGEELVNRCRPVIMFTSVAHAIKAFDITQKDIYDTFVNKYGYSIYLFKDWLGNGEPLTFEGYVQAMEYPMQAFRFLAVPKENVK